MLYRLLAKGGVIKTDTGETIPDNPDNRHWNVYQEWLAVPNVPDPVAVVTPPTLDEEIAGLSDWTRAIIEEAFPNMAMLKARVTAIRAAKGGN